MANYVCKYCGCKGGTNIAGIPCSKSPTKGHVIINEQPQYVCKYCGCSGGANIAGIPCSKSPTKGHELLG